MTRQEMKDLVKQLVYSHNANRISSEPFYWHFCNVQEGGITDRNLNLRFPGIKDHPITVTDKSYLDLYPKEKLVYLTPNSPEELDFIDSDMVYIVGALVDKAKEEPLAYAKAKREGIRSARFPLEKYTR